MADGCGAGGGRGGGADQPGRPGLPALLAGQAGDEHDVGLRLQPVHGQPHQPGRLHAEDNQTEAGGLRPHQGAGGGAGQQLAPAVQPPLHRVRPDQGGGRGAGQDDGGQQGEPRPGDGQERREPGRHLLLPHVSLAPAGVRGLLRRLPAGPALQLQQARGPQVPGGLPLPLLRPGGLHHQQRDHHPQPRRPGAVEERLPAERLREGEQGLH